MLEKLGFRTRERLVFVKYFILIRFVCEFHNESKSVFIFLSLSPWNRVEMEGWCVFT